MIRSATLSCGEMRCAALEYGVYHWSRIPQCLET